MAVSDQQKWNYRRWNPGQTEGINPEHSEPTADTGNGGWQVRVAGSRLAAQKGPPQLSLLLAGVGILAAIVVAVLSFNRPDTSATFQDLGAGISRAAGLRGHLTTRWLGKAQYKLSFVPLDPLQGAGFSFVAGNPPQPLSFYIKLLDSTGFVLCGKEILLPYDRASAAGFASSAPQLTGRRTDAARLAESADLARGQAQEQQRERGKDIFQNQIGDDGQVAALNAQGVLPCSADQYKRFSYWDFSTNFPTLTEQDALMKQRAAAAARAVAEARVALRRKNALKNRSAFFAVGDDRISRYDSSTSVLQTGDGRSFLVTKPSDQAAANAWAANSALVHYRCDQNANCSLTHSGGSGVIYAKSIR